MIKEALIVVDVQNDFCPGGKLAVREGDQVVEPLNQMIKQFHLRNMLVIFTRDWHPKGSDHFLPKGSWPEHCVQGTEGAAFHPRLNLEGAVIVSKGISITDDAYSGFEARDKNGANLEEILRTAGATRLLVGGLATDYCVQATAIDGSKRGFRTTLLLDTCRSVDMNKGDGEKALIEMLRAGVEISLTKKVTEKMA